MRRQRSQARSNERKRERKTMTREVLKKIEGTNFCGELEYKKRERKRLIEAKCERGAENAKASIAGYVQALRDCGVITERERQVLYIYYATL